MTYNDRRTLMESSSKIDSAMAVYAFRYCLGRQTYAVSDCVSWLIANWDILEENDQKLIIKETREALRHGSWISKIDEIEWCKLIDAVQGGH